MRQIYDTRSKWGTATENHGRAAERAGRLDVIRELKTYYRTRLEYATEFDDTDSMYFNRECLIKVKDTEFFALATAGAENFIKEMERSE